MSRLWVDPPEGWKHGFPAIYNPETDGQMREWIVNKGYPVQTIKEYGEQWHVRCWPAEEPKECPDEVINAQEQLKAVENAPIGTKMRKTTREEKISKPAVYEVPTEAVLEMRDYIRVLENLVRELGDRLAKLEKESISHSGQNRPNLFKTTAMTDLKEKK
jgi:hypothetical protein